MAKLVSKTYGDALFAVAVEENKMDLFFTEVQDVLEVLRTNEELSRLMNHPKIIKEDKVKIRNIRRSCIPRDHWTDDIIDHKRSLPGYSVRI